VKVGICKTRNRIEFLSLGIIALDQYSIAAGANPSTLYTVFSQSIAYKLLDSSTTASVLEQAVHF